MLVKIVCGTYGYRDKSGVLMPKDIKSEPFELDNREAARLIDAGVAVEMEETVSEETETEDCIDMEQLKNMDKKELVQLAKDMGIQSYGNKEELIERIISAQKAEPEEETGDSLPELKPAEPEV